MNLVTSFLCCHFYESYAIDDSEQKYLTYDKSYCFSWLCNLICEKNV